MSQPFVGEIRLAGFNFAPINWAFCNGQLLPIENYEALFALIGTTYGGDGVRTFGLPNLAGRVPLHQGTDTSGNVYVIGEISGTESVTLLTQQLPAHNHPVLASKDLGTSAAPVANYVPGDSATVEIYHTPKTVVAMSAASGRTGGSQPHDNIMPFLCVNYIISLFGVFPSQS